LYALDTSVLEELAPDLIVTQALCDVCAVAEDDIRQAILRLPKKPAVINLTPTSLPQVFDAVDLVAQATGSEQRAAEVKSRLHDRIHAVTDRSAMIRRQPRVAFVEWLIPPFSSGHWNPDLVDMAGGREGLGRSGMPSRTLDWREVVAWQPEILFVACCGYDVSKTLQDLERLRSEPHWSSIPAFRNHRVYVADGSQYFNRPGPRLVDSLEILAHALHPDVHPIPDDLVEHQAILWK
jgi:iron complex transport system substrate-binding protein